jgi:hypothetical protein
MQILVGTACMCHALMMLRRIQESRTLKVQLQLARLRYSAKKALGGSRHLSDRSFESVQPMTQNCHQLIGVAPPTFTEVGDGRLDLQPDAQD